jgi:short-chain fatty acids transporter
MQKITKLFTHLIQNFLPGAYTFAVLLTLACFILVLAFTQTSLLDAASLWGNGLWQFNNFAMQMVLVLLLGGAIAKSPLLSRPIRSVGTLASSNTKAVMWMSFISLVACYFNWGFGLIISALIAFEMIKFNKNLNNGLVIASAYSGFLVWHGGISGSIALKLTDPSGSIKPLLSKPSFSLSETIFSSFNLSLLALTIFVILVINFLLSKRKYHQSFDVIREDVKEEDIVPKTFSQKIEHSKVFMGLLVLLGVTYLISYFLESGSFTLPLMIMIFMLIALISNKTIYHFIKSCDDSVKTCTGIIIQFPLYAGIMALLSSSGLATQLCEFFVSLSTKESFLFNTYLSSGILNFFVPSGGGQWVIQGPIIMKAANLIGIEQSRAAMAISWGDAWTNMIQPFWALPALAIAGLRAKDIMGYCLIVLFVSGLIISLGLSFL